MAKETDIIDTMTSDEFLASLGIVIEAVTKNTKEANDVVGDVDDFLSSLGL